LLKLARATKELERREEAARLENSLIEFYKAAWETIDPAPYVDGWHLHAIAEHLEAVSRREIRKLLITVPPRHSKTLMTSVVWPAWLWTKERNPETPLIGPQVKFLALSYGDDLALDSALLMRRLVESDWYQQRWGKRVKLRADQEAKSKFDNTAGGTRISAGFGGTLTGRGGDIKIIDDCLKADDAESEVKREAVIRRYDGTLKSRMTDPKHTAEVVIMQRLHERDLAGHILDTDPDVEHLMLPVLFEPERRFYTSIGWTDPRQDDGEILWPERFDDRSLATFKRNAYEFAGQWMQRPEVRGGSIIKRDDWQHYVTDDGRVPNCEYIVASVDPAYTSKQENDPSGFVVVGVFYDEGGNSKVIVLNAWQKRLELHGRTVERLPNEVEADYVKRSMPHWGLVEHLHHHCKRFRCHQLLIESKASGISVAQEMRRLHSGQGWGVTLVDPKGADKVARVHAVQHVFAEGMVHLPAFSDGTLREWGERLVDQCAAFPKGANDDMVDALTQALKHLRDRGMLIRRDERAAELEEMRRHRGSPPPPLYSV
jgi:predicted phage terminase large subunit-like protein